MKVCHVNTFDWQGVAHSMLHRRSVIVHTIFAGHMSRVDAARRNEAGVQVMTMGQLAARLAGGLLQPVDLDVLTETVRDALADVEMGELEPIKDLPGMPAAVAATFDKAWRAGVDLSEVGHPRTAALASLEQVVVQRLPASMKRPGDLVALAPDRARRERPGVLARRPQACSGMAKGIEGRGGDGTAGRATDGAVLLREPAS